jgi:hypothetical protein
MMLGGVLVVVAAGLVAALVGGTVSGIVLSGAVNFGAAIGRLAFESSGEPFSMTRTGGRVEICGRKYS